MFIDVLPVAPKKRMLTSFACLALVLPVDVDYIFSFIMILYADRGLVRNGEISPMFQLLFSLTTTFFGIWYLLGIVIRFILQNQETQDIVNEICSTHATMANKLGAFKNIGKFGRIIGGFLIGLLYLRSIKFVRNRSKNKSKPPAIFGRYQRNLLTYSDTIILISLLIFSSPFHLYSLFQIFNVNLHQLTLTLIRSIGICIIIGILLPAYTLFNLKKKIPDFFSESNSCKNVQFSLKPHSLIEPRRDLKPSEMIELKSIMWSSRRTERCYGTNCTCSRCFLILQKMKLPKIIVTSEDTNTKIIFVNECIDHNFTNADYRV